MTQPATPKTAAPEEVARADAYGFLAALLRQPPQQDMLDRCAGLPRGEGVIGDALGQVAEAARAASPEAVSAEYDALFIGLGRGELLPYASVYLTGFLNEKPLALLRQDMRKLGIARAAGVPEPEDHIAALCESMAALIVGQHQPPASLATQNEFFSRHIAPWAPHFFTDLAQAKSARFYRPVGQFGSAFVVLEAEATRLAP